MKLGLLLPLLASGAVALVACSSSSDSIGSQGAEAIEDAPSEATISLGADLAYADRDCGLTVRWTGNASTVAIAGEWSGWEQIQLTPSGNGAFETTLAPSATLRAGELNGYKLVIDGSWVLDPGAHYRKIVGGEMNSGLQLPACAAAPEVTAAKLTATKDGKATVRTTVKKASGGPVPSRLGASLDRKAVAAGSYTVNPDATVDFSFTGLPKGKHTLSLRALDASGNASEPIDLPFWVEDEPFDYRDGALYMMMIDRFANGDASNDAPVGAPVHYDADWHGGDLQGALRVMKSGYFEKLGVRTVWLSPLNMQTSKYQSGDGNRLFSAYHGYWPISATKVEPRFGGDEALKAFVAEAHSRGIRVLLDLINNQVHEDHEYLSKNPDWFRTTCQCGDDANGCGWSVRPIDCQFQPYLPDINWTVPGAEKQFVADAVHWVTAFDFDGFRVDAVKHVEANSVYNMRAELARRFEQGGSRIYMVGETAVGEYDRGTFFGVTYQNGYEWIDAYVGDTALDGQFDFVTRNNMADGLVNGDKPLNECETELKKAETKFKSSSSHVRFLNGHDNPRIASIAAHDPKLGCNWRDGCRGDQLPPLAYTDPVVYQRLKRALTVLYTFPGVPYIYMGDEVAFGGGGDPDMRRNMLFGEEGLEAVQMKQWESATNGLSDQQKDLRSWVRKLGALRTGSKALRRADRTTLLGSDANLWVYAYQASPTDLAIVAVNRGNAVSGKTIDASNVDLGSVSALASPLGTGSATVSGSSLKLTLGAGEAAVFVAKTN